MSTQDLRNLKSTDRSAYKALACMAKSFSFWGGEYKNEECRRMTFHSYNMLKMSMLGIMRPYFDRTFLIGCSDMSKDGLAFKCLTRRQLRKWEKKQVA
jgi:hypothetical protein